jgi:hypothetical protein
MKKVTFLLALCLSTFLTSAQLRFSMVTVKDSLTKKSKHNVLTLLNGKEQINYTWNDTIVRQPEKTIVLFEEQKNDTLYALLYISTFSKVTTTSANARCFAGKEKRVFFVKWSRKDNQAKWKNKCVESCLLSVTNMTKDETISSWDKKSELVFKTLKANTFVDLVFNPSRFWEGLKSVQ